MREIERDDLGRELSAEQSSFFAESKIRDDSGKLMTLYHGSSYEFDAFDISKIRANESDAYYNGFWFSSDKYTLPAWTKLKARYEVYINVCNPAPMEVVNKVVKEVRSQWMQSSNSLHVIRPEANSIQDEVRYRLQDMGYDGVIHDWKPEVNRQELEETGQTVVTSARGRKYVLKKNEDWGGLDLFYYEKDANDHLGDHLTGYEDVDDYLRLQECTVVCFRPEQIKAVDNRTPTLDPNFKYNTPEKEVKNSMSERMSLIYKDSYGDDNTVYPKLDFYKSDNSLYVGLDEYDSEFDFMEPYCDVTVNLDVPLPYLEACIDTNNNGQKMVDFLVQNGFGEPTGLMIPSGFCRYPVFRFNEEKLREIDPKTFEAYAKAHGMDKPSLDAQIAGANTKKESSQKNRYYKTNDGWFDYYVNETTGQKKFKLDENDVLVEKKRDDFHR